MTALPEPELLLGVFTEDLLLLPSFMAMAAMATARADACSDDHSTHRQADAGSRDGRTDGLQHGDKGRADRGDEGTHRGEDGGEGREQVAREGCADGLGRCAEGAFKSREGVLQGATQLPGQRGNVAKAAGNALEELLSQRSRALRQPLCALSENAVQAVHQREGVVGELLLLVGGQARVEGGCRPLADAHPVAALHGFPQCAEDALVGAVFEGRPEAVQCLGGAVLDALGHLLGAVGGNGS